MSKEDCRSILIFFDPFQIDRILKSRNDDLMVHQQLICSRFVLLTLMAVEKMCIRDRGSGQGFVEASKKMKAKAPHKLNNTLVWLNGAHAAGVTMRCV